MTHNSSGRKTAVLFRLVLVLGAISTGLAAGADRTEESPVRLAVHFPRSNNGYFSVTVNSVPVITGGHFYFANKAWRNVGEVLVNKFTVRKKGDGGEADGKFTFSDTVNGTVKIKWTARRIEITFNYDIAQNSNAAFAVAELYLPLPLVESCIRGNGDKGEFHSLGKLHKKIINTCFGKLTWTFATNGNRGISSADWILSDTRSQKWRQEQLRSFRFLNNCERKDNEAVSRCIKAVLEIEPRKHFDKLVEVDACLHTLKIMESRSQSAKQQIENDHALSATRDYLKSILKTGVDDPVKVDARLQSLRFGIKTIAAEKLGVPVLPPLTPRIIPEPREMKMLDKDFIIDDHTVIVVPDPDTDAEPYGATILQEELQKYFGVPIVIVAPSKVTATARPIMVGVTGGKFPALHQACREMSIQVTPDNPGPEGYVLLAKSRRILIMGSDAAGAFYGVQSLLQLIRRKPDNTLAVKGVQVRDWPVLKHRGFQLVMNNSKNIDFHKRLIRRVVARHKCNWLLYGIAGIDRIKWKSHPEISSRESNWSTEQIRECVRYARKHHLKVVPWFNLGGKAKGVLAKYPQFAESPKGNVFDFSNPELRKLISDVLQEMMDAFEKPEIVNIGMDELYPLGGAPGKHKRKPYELFAEYLTWLHDWLKAHGARTMMWQDMLLDHSTWKPWSPSNSLWIGGQYEPLVHPAVHRIPKDIIMAVWVYGGYNHLKDYPSLRYFQRLGFPVVACSWYDRINNFYFAKAAAECNAWGFLGTTWTMCAWQCPNTGSLLAAEYAWTPNTPALETLPYDPLRRMALAWQKPKPSGSTNVSEPIDITPFCNRSLCDRVAGDARGWLDDGPLYDLSLMPTGAVRLAGIRFDLIPESRNNGLQCIAAGGTAMKDRGLPRAVTNITVNRKARSLVFLHTANDLMHARHFAEYKVHYDDNTVETVPLDALVNIGPSRKRTVFAKRLRKRLYTGYIREARRAWVGMNMAGETIDLHAYEWVNPHPGKTIMAIDLIVRNRNGAVLLLGISVIP